MKDLLDIITKLKENENEERKKITLNMNNGQEVYNNEVNRLQSEMENIIENVTNQNELIIQEKEESERMRKEVRRKKEILFIKSLFLNISNPIFIPPFFLSSSLLKG